MTCFDIRVLFGFVLLGCTDPVVDDWNATSIEFEDSSENNVIPYSEEGITIFSKLELAIASDLTGSFLLEGAYNSCENGCTTIISVQTDDSYEYTITSTEDDSFSMDCIFAIPNLQNGLICSYDELDIHFVRKQE